MTSRHDPFPPRTEDNKLFEYKSSSSGKPPKGVLLLSEPSFKEYLVFIQKQLIRQAYRQDKIVYWSAREGAPKAARGLADAQSAIEEAEAAKKALIEFRHLVVKG